MHYAELFFRAKWFIIVIEHIMVMGRISQFLTVFTNSSYNFILY